MKLLIFVLTSVYLLSHGLWKERNRLLLATLDKQIVLLVNTWRDKLVVAHARSCHGSGTRLMLVVWITLERNLVTELILLIPRVVKRKLFFKAHLGSRCEVGLTAQTFIERVVLFKRIRLFQFLLFLLLQKSMWQLSIVQVHLIAVQDVLSNCFDVLILILIKFCLVNSSLLLHSPLESSKGIFPLKDFHAVESNSRNGIFKRDVHLLDCAIVTVGTLLTNVSRGSRHYRWLEIIPRCFFINLEFSWVYS